MNYQEAKEHFEKLFQGEMSESEGRDFLISLYEKGETVDEIQAAVEVMRSHTIKLKLDKEYEDKLFDIVGTGGDRSGTFNISTTSSFVLAAAGLMVAKHGNRSITSKSGSADVLDVLGINLNLDLNGQKKLLEETGFTFLFAQNHHPAMKHIMPIRKSIPHGTIFNILGPMTNPADVKQKFIGVFHEKYITPMTKVLSQTGSKRAMVVCGSDGLDEITITGITKANFFHNDTIEELEIDPQKFGFKLNSIDSIKGGDANENAAITNTILKGAENSSKLDIVILNSGASLYTSGVARDLQEGFEIAKEMIDSGKAYKTLEKCIKVSKKL